MQADYHTNITFTFVNSFRILKETIMTTITSLTDGLCIQLDLSATKEEIQTIHYAFQYIY